MLLTKLQLANSLVILEEKSGCADPLFSKALSPEVSLAFVSDRRTSIISSTYKFDCRIYLVFLWKLHNLAFEIAFNPPEGVYISFVSSISVLHAYYKLVLIITELISKLNYPKGFIFYRLKHI